MKKLPSAVVFDMDGLLFDSEALYRDAVILAAGDLGHSFTVEDYLSLVGRPWVASRVTLQKHLGTAGDVDAFRAKSMQYYNSMRSDLTLKPVVIQLLDLLDEIQVPRAICTSSSHADVERNLLLYELTKRFDVVVASGDCPRDKPFPDPFLRAAEMLRVAADDCLALEDSHNGIRASSAARMQSVMVPDLLPPTEEIQNLCDFVATDLHEVRVHLSRLIEPNF